MIGRRKVYRRTEEVLLRDMIGAPIKSLEVIENDINNALSKYMKVCDMHICFKRLTGGEYALRIDGRARDFVAPYLIKD